jgi:hypothetical protein
MRRIGFIGVVLLGAVSLCVAQGPKPDSLVVVLKDGHQKSFSMAEVSRIDFKDGSMLLTQSGRKEVINMADVLRIDFGSSEHLSAGRNRFVGRWGSWSGRREREVFYNLETRWSGPKKHGQRPRNLDRREWRSTNIVG